MAHSRSDDGADGFLQSESEHYAKVVGGGGDRNGFQFVGAIIIIIMIINTTDDFIP